MPVTQSNSEPLIRNDEKMKYRKYGSTGLEVSALSFGCMRLSEDQELNTNLISSAIDLGINYFESTRYYIRGTCQHKIAPGLKDKTAGIIASGKGKLSEDETEYMFRKEIETQLDILGLTHFKFYQVGWFSWAKMCHLLKPGGAYDAIRKAKEEGLIQRLGFTGHDTPENFIKCIETGLFDSITVPYNMINRKYEPLIARAGELGIGVVAMCPVAGGVLSCESDKLKKALKMDLPTSEMAIRFVLSNPNVSTCCSGMNTMEHLEQNRRTAYEFDSENDTSFEEMCEGLELLRKELGDNFCTACSYCMPCPKGINIPHHLALYQNWKTFGLEEDTKIKFNKIPPEESIDNCDNCGACEKACPNELKIQNIFREFEELKLKS
ncbi:MAG: aldo/keto reductase [Planctomycetota bacterium]|jgi:predicted aldo/keto reductase-like oxidoreductase